MYVSSNVYPNVRAVSEKDTTCNINLLKMLEKWKSAVDKGKQFGALLADLSNTFDFISHDPIFCLQNCMLMGLAFPH